MVRRSTWLLLLVLVLVTGIYLYLKYRPAKKTSEPTPTPIGNVFLISEANTKLQSIHIIDKQSKAVQIERNFEGLWTVRLPRPGTADQALAEAAETQIGALRIVTKLETIPPLNAIGLDTPADTISLRYANNVQHTVEVGILTPTGSGYYVRLDNAGVFVVSQSAIESILNLLNNPPYSPTETAVITSTPIPVNSTITPTP